MKPVILLLAAAALAVPGLALAESQTVTVNGSVAKACVLGAPANATLNIGALTNASGQLRPELTGSTPAVQTTIASAWCNTPSVMSVKASPLTMVATPSFPQQPGFARSVTYTATISNWSAPLTNRPLAADNSVSVNAAGAQAATPSLGIAFSNLAPLVGGSEDANALIEAGNYSTTIQITLAAAS